MNEDTPNRILCAAFRDTLTKGFFAVESDEVLTGEEAEKYLVATKAWRNELWKQFRELEDRLCPVQAHARKRNMTLRETP